MCRYFKIDTISGLYFSSSDVTRKLLPSRHRYRPAVPCPRASQVKVEVEG